MSSPSPTPTPSPSPSAAPHPPPQADRRFSIWNPGGDPAILTHAAQAWRTLAAGLRVAQQDLDRHVSALRSGWTGTASDGFQSWSSHLSGDLTESATECDRVAAQLDEVASRIRSTNEQVHELWVAMGMTAALGIGLTFFTLGTSDAAAGTAAAADTAEAASLVATLTNFLDSTLGRWVVTFGINLFATGVEKAWVNADHNPFEGWTPDDLAHALLGADALAVAGPLAEKVPGFPGLKAAHPFAAAATVSGSAAGAAAFAGDLTAFGFDGRPLGLDTLTDVGVSAGVSGLISGSAEWAAARFVTKPSPVAEIDPVIEEAAPGDVLRAGGLHVDEAPGWERTPTGLVRPPAPPGWNRSGSGLLLPASSDSSPVELVRGTTPVPKVAGIGPDDWQDSPTGMRVPKPGASVPDLGVRFKPQRGNLWQESRQVRKSTFKLVLKGLSDTVLHSPSSAVIPPPPTPNLLIAAPGPAPSVPPPPPPPVVGGGTYTVRTGDSLWRIAHRTYGDGELWRLLYRANAGIGPDPGTIRPGHVLTIPSIVRPAA